MSKHYPVEQRERAVKMVRDHLDEYRSVYAAYQVIGPNGSQQRQAAHPAKMTQGGTCARSSRLSLITFSAP